jgi:hypothetical protein
VSGRRGRLPRLAERLRGYIVTEPGEWTRDALVDDLDGQETRAAICYALGELVGRGFVVCEQGVYSPAPPPPRPKRIRKRAKPATPTERLGCVRRLLTARLEPVGIVEIAEYAGVSRVRVRTELRKLAAEGAAVERAPGWWERVSVRRRSRR